MRPNGALLCARYAFAPNLYQYCGPDTKGDLESYLKAELADGGLVEHLKQFETIFPYFQAIAQANKIKDPFDARVVEAYWVGNELLERMSEEAIHEALTVGQRLPQRLPKKELKWILPKIDQRARLHHSFHVMNVFTRTGHRMVAETVETVDECRISWGKVLRQNQSGSPHSARIGADDSTSLKSVLVESKNLAQMIIASQKLIYQDGKLKLVPFEKDVVVAQESLGKRLKPGDWVSVHWGIVCDRLSGQQVKQLEKYTQHHLKLANETI